mgnify:CR=1 FL=1
MSAPVDIRGKVFGELTAIEPTGLRRGGRIVWRCRCTCGAEVFVPAKELRSGNTKSCGHLKKQTNDLTGQRFGKLVAEYDTGKRYQHNAVWHCKCDCGAEVDVIGRSLTSGNTRSCGCLNHAPRAASPDVLDDFNPRAPHGARLRLLICGLTGIYFNPRAPHGARLRATVCRRCRWHFNPRAPHGARPHRADLVAPPVGISIHALRMERDSKK